MNLAGRIRVDWISRRSGLGVGVDRLVGSVANDED